MKLICDEKTGELKYKIIYNKTPKECKICNKSIRSDSFERHINSKRHKMLEQRNKELNKKDEVKLKETVDDNADFNVLESLKKNELEEILKNCKITKSSNGSIHLYNKNNYESFKSRYNRDKKFKQNHLKKAYEKIECECGRSYMKCHKSRHLRSPIHKKNLQLLKK
jgi:hypothetical protein